MTFPIRTAREYPTIGSHLVPVATFCLGIVLLFLLAAPWYLMFRAHAPRGLAFAAAHLLTRCALSGLHSQPLIFLLAAPYRACIRSRSSLLVEEFPYVALIYFALESACQI